MAKKKKKSHKNNVPSGGKKSAFDALGEVKKLQKKSFFDLSESETSASFERTERSVGSDDLLSDERTGGDLKWFEKVQDAKLDSVETRLGAQTTKMILELKGSMNEKLSTIESGNSKHTTSIIVTIIVGFFVAFMVFYFSAIGIIENNVEDSISGKIQILDSRIIIIDGRIEKLENRQVTKNRSNIKAQIDND